MTLSVKDAAGTTVPLSSYLDGSSEVNPRHSIITSEGAGATIGAVGDAAVVINSTGTLSGKLRGLVAILADVWDSAGHWLSTALLPRTSGGYANYHLVSVGSTNTGSVKAAPGQLYGWNIFNNAAYAVYVKLHNTAGTPTAGAGVVKTIAIPAGGGSNKDLVHGMAFSTGIGISIVKDLADGGSTAVLASDCVVDIEYK